MKTTNVTQFDRSVDYYVEQGAYFIKEGNYLKALKNLFCALRKKSSDVPSLIHLAIAYQKMGLIDASNSALYKILANDPQNEGAFALLGQNFSLSGDHLRELFYLKNFSEMTEDQGLMDLFANAPNFLPRFEQVYPMTKEMRDAMNNRGTKLIQAGHLGRAAECFNEVLESFPDDVFAKNQLCVIYTLQGKNAQAIDLAKQVVIKDGKNVNGWCNLALALFNVGNIQQSDDAIHRALLVETNNDEDIRLLVKVLCITKKYKSAVVYAQKVLKNNPFDVDYLTFAAVACFNCGDFEKAKDYFLQLNAIFPDTQILKYNLNVVEQVLSGEKQAEQMAFDLSLPPEEETRITIELENMDYNKVWDCEEYERYISWAFSCENLGISQYILDQLYLSDSQKTQKILKNLLAQDYGWQFKAMALWKYLLHYPRENIYANKDGYFVPLEMPEKNLLKNDEMPFWRAFAFLSVLFVQEDDWLDKLVFSANLVDEKFDLVSQSDFSVDEIAALIVRSAKLEDFDDKQICAMFRVAYNRLAKITELVFGI
ncbi:MAG: hypothetical protein E7344_01680 [Clostridiales bacterium]|nr:hypothetical protein [Clostridiales bacterium]